MSIDHATQHFHPRVPGSIDSKAFGIMQPSGIADLALWLRADTIPGLGDGDMVATWPDDSGGGKDFVQATDGKKPTYQTGEINSLPVVRFDGSNDIVTNAVLNGGVAVTLYFVIRPTATTPSGMFDSGSGLSDVLRNYSAGNMEIQENDPRVALSLANTNAVLLEWRATSTPAHSIDYYKNGSYIATGSTATTGAIKWGTVGIGCINGTATPYAGDIAEVIMYIRYLTDAERSRVQTYLNAKWALW